MSSPHIRRVSLYCLAIFNFETGTPLVFAYTNSKDCIDCFCLYKDSKNLFPYTFSKEIFVTDGHPLYKLGEPIVCTNGFLKLQK